jgi:hypothetical protein
MLIKKLRFRKQLKEQKKEEKFLKFLEEATDEELRKFIISRIALGIVLVVAFLVFWRWSGWKGI